MTELTFDAAKPRLLAAFDRGLLVPFIGSGMSSGACPTWSAFVLGLEVEAGIEPPSGSGDPDSRSLIRRADAAMRILRRRGNKHVEAAVRKTLYGEPATGYSGGTTAQTKRLAEGWWPLVITSNYDDLYERELIARRKAEDKPRREGGGHDFSDDEYLTIAGRSADDCHRVLASLSTTTPPVLWAIQGYVARSEGHRRASLASEVVIGHEDYQRVTHRDVHVRRAFAEVFRRRSLLFLGFGLAEQYFLDLFGEVLEFMGMNPQPHYALMHSSNDIDAEFLRRRFNILTIPYDDDDHHSVGDALEVFGTTRQARSRATSWSFRVETPGDGNAVASTSALQIVHAPLEGLDERECGALSAGLEKKNPYPSDSVLAFAEKVAPGFHADAREGRLQRSGDYLYVARTPRETAVPLIAVSAWRDERTRDIRLIGDATEASLQWAFDQGFRTLRAPLLAAGRGRHFPARFSLAEMVRAYGRWRRRTGHALSLVIHVIDHSVLFEITSGRLDVLEMVSATNVRFWVEVRPESEAVERDFALENEDTTLEQLITARRLAGDEWEVEVDPPASARLATRPVRECRAQSLRDLGVMPGATLRFRHARSSVTA